MYCKVCGAEIKEGSKFCNKCGSKVENTSGDMPSKNKKSTKQPKMRKHKSEKETYKKILIIVGIIIGVLIIGFAAAIGFFNVQLTKKSAEINKFGVKDFIELKDEVLDGEFILNPFEFKEKFDEIDEIKVYIERYKNIKDEFGKIDEEKYDYSFAGNLYNEYKELIREAKKAINSENVLECFKLLDEAENLLPDLLEESDRVIKDIIKEYKDLDISEGERDLRNEFERTLSKLEEVDLEAYKKIEDDIEKKYETAREAYRECKGLTERLNEIITEYIDQKEEYIEQKKQQQQASPSEVKMMVRDYLYAFGDAMTYSDFSYISPYLKPGSSIYNTQKNFVKNGCEESLESYDILDVDFRGSTNCIVSTRETYTIRRSGEGYRRLTQECKYKAEYTDGKWQLTAFAEQVKKVSENPL